MARYRRGLFVAAGVLLTPLCSACSAYVQTGAPRVLLAPRMVDEIHLGRSDGRVVMLLKPTVVRDTVWGRLAADSGSSATGVALKDVEWAMARGRRASFRQTMVGVVILLLSGYLVALSFAGF